MRLIEERRGSSVISYVYEPNSYVPLARIDAEGDQTQQGGLGSSQDEKPQEQAANDDSMEARYWASLTKTAMERAKALGLDKPKPPKICNIYYFHNDINGCPEELTNERGQIVWQASYKTWGATVTEDWEVVHLNGSEPVFGEGDKPKGDYKAQNLRFQGQYLDRDTGLHYNTFRYYDPDIGRFVSPDPIGLMGGTNLHSYAPNPIAWIDPWGWATANDTFTASNGLTLDVGGYTDISHLSTSDLKRIEFMNGPDAPHPFGLSPVDKQGNTIVMHHEGQNPAGPITGMPEPHHGEGGQHPFGKQKGMGLSKEQRAAFNVWKKEFWRYKAQQALRSRGC